MRKSFALVLVALLSAGSGLAVVEVGPGARIFQDSLGSNVNFSQDANFSFIGVREDLTDFGNSNFTVEPESSSGAELDFYRPFADRQEYVSNFTARASTRQEVSFNVSDLPSDDFYEAFFSENGTRIFIGYTGGDEAFNFSYSVSSEDVSLFNYGEKGVEAEQLLFNSSDPVEGNSVKVSADLLNEGVVDAENPNTSLLTETYNGSEWVKGEKIFETFDVPANSSTLGNFSWEAEPGPWRFTVEADPEDEIKETNETNNEFKESLNVDSYQLVHGGTDLRLELGVNTDDLYIWNPSKEEGFLYFSDVDSSFSYNDLRPVNGSEFPQVDRNLSMVGHNDSVEELWDDDGDGYADHIRSWNVGGNGLDVPVVNSSSAGTFETGILYDTGDGSPYDGSQDLVFVTKLKPATAGKNGVYDYEARIPHGLRSLRPNDDSVRIYQELK